MEESKKVSIEGIVTPSLWDDQGNVLNIYIAGINEENFALANNKKCLELYDYLGAVVRLHGMIAASIFYTDGYEIIKDFKRKEIL